MLPPLERLPPADRISRILDAVGWDIVPADLDYGALEKDIENSVAHYWAAVDRHSDEHRRARINQLEKVKKAVLRAADLMRPLAPEKEF
jgi:hypothetical protein